MTPDTFWTYVVRGKAHECWPWQGSLTADGHGSLRWRGRTTKAHRVAYELGTGQPVLPHVVIRHLCNSPSCCNPAHLALGSHSDNVADRVAAGRSACGERNGRARLTWQQVDEIRRLYARGWPVTPLAQKYDVSVRTIGKIVRYEVWQPEQRASRFAKRDALAEG